MGVRKLSVSEVLVTSVFEDGVGAVVPRVPVRGLEVLAARYVAHRRVFEVLVRSNEFEGPEPEPGEFVDRWWDRAAPWAPLFERKA